MNITNSHYIHSSPNVQGLQRAFAGQVGTGQGGIESIRSTASIRDSVSFSEEALRLSDANKTSADSSSIRFDLVNRIKAEIGAGTYDTSEKMDIALERMLARHF